MATISRGASQRRPSSDSTIQPSAIRATDLCDPGLESNRSPGIEGGLNQRIPHIASPVRDRKELVELGLVLERDLQHLLKEIALLLQWP